MGHIRLGTLPTSKKWREVVALLETGGSVDEIAAAASKAAASDLQFGSKDPIFRYVAQLLVELPLAARSPGFASELERLGLGGSVPNSLSDLLARISGAVDREAFDRGRFSDFGDIAKAALVESLGAKLNNRLPSLFDPEPSEIRAALGRLAGGSDFASLAREFFARLTYRSLDYYLSRELADHTGEERRFRTDAERVRFEAALFQHTFEASKIVEAFAGGWYGKTIWRDDALTPDAIEKFSSYAFKKLRSELERREIA